MPDITEVVPKGRYPGNAVTDCVLLDHDMRVRRRIVFTTVGGEKVRLNAPEVVQLRDGDGLKLDDGRMVRVVARREALIEIRAAGPAEMVRIAWHLGNRHLPTQFVEGRLRIRADHVIAEMVSGLGGECRAIDAAFDPEGGAYAGGGKHGHHDRHSHDPHDHHHDHGEAEAGP